MKEGNIEMIPNNSIIQPNNGMNNFSNPMLPMMPSGMIFVKGQNEATNYPLARGTRAPLFDSEEEIFYIKSVDVYGNTQPLKAYSYKEISLQNDSANTTSGVSSEEFQSLKDELAELKKLIEAKQTPEVKQNFDKKPYRKENRNNG